VDAVPHGVCGLDRHPGGGVAAFAILWPHVSPAGKWMVCCWSLPAWVSVFNGQDVALLLLWAALAVWLLRRGKEATAGAVLALCAAKYHLVVLVR